MNAYAANKPVCKTIVRARIEYGPMTPPVSIPALRLSLSPRLQRKAGQYVRVSQPIHRLEKHEECLTRHNFRL